MTDKRFLKGDREQVELNQSPIYVPLDPDWADSKTMHDPLMARGWFSNAWVMYEPSELPGDMENQRHADSVVQPKRPK